MRRWAGAITFCLIVGHGPEPWAQEPPASGDATGAIDRPWAVTLWTAWGTDGEIERFPVLDSNLEQSWFAGLGLSYEFARTGEHFRWEITGILAKHFGQQTHVEGDLALALRWDGFSWNDTVYTSAAFASGVSYASRLPSLEEEISPPSQRLLHFLLFELEMARPADPDRSVVLALHHRSSAYGLYGTEHGGSNFVALGLRQRF